MASLSAVAAREIDVIDTAPAFTAADVAALEARFAGVATDVWLPELLNELTGRVAVVSSFGTESAVLCIWSRRSTKLCR
jgi:phosphoadenosine phosphosulfate reductase